MQTVRRFAFLALAAGVMSLSFTSNASADSSALPQGRYQVVSFGDSLSDVGTYAYARQFGGGTYTTNPGAISVARVAQHFGSSLTPALTGGFGQPSVVQADGFGYAQGGARVAAPPNPGDATGDTGELQTPLTSQVSAYLQSHTRFNAQQLVLMQGGANDLQDAYAAWAGMVANGGDPNASLQAVLPSLKQAAQQLGELVHNVQQHGATHIVVQNVPDISKAPIANLLDQQLPGSTKVLRRMAQAFNGALDDALPASPAVLRIDAFTFIDEVAKNYRQLGFRFDGSVGANVACAPASLPTAFQADDASALFCSPATYVSPHADDIYMFADAYHPSTHLQQVIADYVVAQIDAWLRK
ncbi:SGNH/GDSL hydrolase family protein [Burkholderia sp. Ax-1719]|uniref:SGNH/GDSL hydrolase family protein n=1 Tax=Burkholderia sp. Ax-1719 TaxID=2608334 RepID=UPI0014241CD7|nr:SGNH/GDSL hydrolase family protein [Burkholderia sp. Ax-1719]NIE64330.1 lipase [Burkholderia sp. Ax-1719]